MTSLQHHYGAIATGQSTPKWSMGDQHHFGAQGAMSSVNNIEALRVARDWSRPELGRRMQPPTSGQQIERIEKGLRKLSQDWIDRAAAAFGVAPEAIISDRADVVAAAMAAREPSKSSADDELQMVGIQHVDLAFGMGATFTDSHIEVAVLNFPKVWVEAITYSPPDLLTWARGQGDSMSPTINDGDMVLIDRSKRKVKEQDAIWAFAVGDVGSIKRLRVKGDRYIILSDNPSVPDDEEPQDFVRIVGRVVFVGAKK